MAVVDRIGVPVFGPAELGRRLAEHSNAFQSRYWFEPAENAAGEPEASVWAASAPMHLVNANDLAPFSVRRETGVAVNTHSSANLSRYLGISEEDYVMMGALLGLTQWRVLERNSLLNPEDWLQEDHAPCLFTPRMTVYDYALMLERAPICAGCREFYRCLGAETELCLIRELCEALA